MKFHNVLVEVWIKTKQSTHTFDLQKLGFQNVQCEIPAKSSQGSGKGFGKERGFIRFKADEPQV